jgi:hypothetical protein
LVMLLLLLLLIRLVAFGGIFSSFYFPEWRLSTSPRHMQTGSPQDKHFGVLTSEDPYKQPRITKNNFGRDMLWGVPISECS